MEAKRRHICKVRKIDHRVGGVLTPLSIGEYKTILQLVGILSHGKVAKRLTDLAIDQMEGVQNLRRAIFEYVPCFQGNQPCLIFLQLQDQD